MLASGFTSASVTRVFFFGLIASSIIVSITDTKYLFPIKVVPHLWQYRQLWRVLIWQSFLLSTFPATTILPPLLLTLLRPLTFGALNSIPAGPTPLIFALLAQYHAAIPTVYKYRIVTSSSSSANNDEQGLVLSDKSIVYLLSGQLALSSLPGSALAASVGWFIGVAWRAEWGPAAWSQWRVPGWIVGEKKGERGEGFEVLRRRMGGEGAGTGSAVDDGAGGGEARRRTLGRGILDQFRGAS